MPEQSSTRGTRLKGELDEKYQDYRDGNDMTDSEALRRLVRVGLDAEAESNGGGQESTSARSASNRIIGGVKIVADEVLNWAAISIAFIFVYSVYIDDGPIATVLLLLTIGAVVWVISTVVDRIDARADKIDGSYGDAVRSIIRREKPNSNGDAA